MPLLVVSTKVDISLFKTVQYTKIVWLMNYQILLNFVSKMSMVLVTNVIKLKGLNRNKLDEFDQNNIRKENNCYQPDFGQTVILFRYKT